MRRILGHWEVVPLFEIEQRNSSSEPLRNDIHFPGFAPLRIAGGLTYNGMGDLQMPTMGTIHKKGVLVGGLIAGAVLSMSDVLPYGDVLKAQMAVAWGAAGRPRMTDLQRTLEVPASIVLDFVVGILH